MFYEGAIYRPPSEAGSLILQITVGCRHNACTFCSVFKDKRFRIKSEQEIEEIISIALAEYPDAERIFLADGDALTVETSVLVKILDRLYRSFSRLERVGIYGGPKDIRQKSIEELKELKEHGLNIVYLGVESGSARILKTVHKGVTPEEMIAAGQKVMASGLLLSCTVIIGLGGKAYSQEHAIETAKVASAINPHYLAGLTLIVKPEAPIMRSVQKGELELLSPLEALTEIKTLVEHLQVTDCIFRCNHASNYLPLKATLPQEGAMLINIIDKVIQSNQTGQLRPEGSRAL
ncbi:MAG: radical SAM protein [Desulfosporosinus sp. BRH_c37]|nr:MAG: radical SAM protein [Desulfosporosinus sp. BRH_c37]